MLYKEIAQEIITIIEPNQFSSLLPMRGNTVGGNMEYITVIVSETIFFIFHCSSTKQYNVLIVVQLPEIHNLYKD